MELLKYITLFKIKHILRYINNITSATLSDVQQNASFHGLSFVLRLTIYNFQFAAIVIR